jgi:chromosome partitioning protein
MAGMTEGCSVCGREFDVQFRYQMEEREGGFAFFCSQDCHGKSVRGDDSGGATCDACSKRFAVELVSQVVRVKGARRYACSDPCRTQLLAEASGARLGNFLPTEQVAPAIPDVAPQVSESASVSPMGKVSRAPTPVRADRKKIHAPHKLAIFNHKGGTGKTTTTVSIASGLAARGLRVLLVDTDSQGNVGVSLGVKAERSLYHVLVMGLRASDAAVNVRPNLDLIVSNETLAAAELYLAGRQNRDRILRDRLSAAAEDYDVVLLDCSPSLSLMNQNALVFADGILVPVACDFLSLVGVRQVIKTVKNVNSLLHHPVQIYGVLPTFYDARARICRDAVETLKQHFGDRCLSPIRSTIKIKEAPAAGKTIYEYAGDSNAADDYRGVVEHLISGSNMNSGNVSDGVGSSMLSDETTQSAVG